MATAVFIKKFVETSLSVYDVNFWHFVRRPFLSYGNKIEKTQKKKKLMRGVELWKRCSLPEVVDFAKMKGNKFLSCCTT